jgi:DNA repair protein RecN (Recombination protein N)
VPRNVISTSRIVSTSWHSLTMSATLTSLRIRNLALVEEMTWETAPGFVAITGETGAGKSILMGALTLVLGERADKELIRTGAESCSVEAVFDNADDERISSLLDRHGAEPCEDGRLLIKRVVSLSAPGKQFVNGSPCTLALLRSLGNFLIDLHGPHDHQSLFSREHQTNLLDRFAGTEKLSEEFTKARSTVLRLTEEKNSILRDEQTTLREVDLLTYQVREIEAASLQTGEEETLLAKHRIGSSARRIAEICTELAAKAVDSEDSLIAKLEGLSRSVRELVRLDPGATEIEEAFQASFGAVDDFARAVQSYSSALEENPIELPEIESRLDIIQSLKRKYGNSIEDVLSFGEQASRRLNDLVGRSARRETLDEEISAAKEAMYVQGRELTELRTRASAKLAERVRAGLKELGFARSDFSISLERLDPPSTQGNELVEFLFSANPGEPARPLRSIGSSGEISRVMLTLKSALADQDDVPVLVFDEIDANVGGEIAAKVASKMRALGRSRQVLCITHLPQVAAAASRQFVVTKQVVDERTRTLLLEASGMSREEEIARMLGGKSKSALGHARALLNGAG